MPFQYDQSGELIGLVQRLNSPGFIQMYGGTSAPGGWLFCDGSSVLQTDFPDLFLVIGSTYNTGGEAPTEFRLPDFRSRSPIGVGMGTGLSNYVLAQLGGEENHLLSVAEMPVHTHLQNAHTHTQDAHTHVQDSHNHTQDSHNHTQNAHTHTQNSHNHTQDSHNHTQNAHNHVQGMVALSDVTARYGRVNTGVNSSHYDTGSPVTPSGEGAYTSSTTATNIGTTATNQSTTATNQNTTATNQAATAVNVATTATNQNTTATNQNTTATNQNEGGGTSHNTLHPYLAVNFMIKY